MKKKIALFVACVVVSQILAGWICFVSGTELRTSNAGYLFSFALICGLSVGAVCISIMSTSDI